MWCTWWVAGAGDGVGYEQRNRGLHSDECSSTAVPRPYSGLSFWKEGKQLVKLQVLCNDSPSSSPACGCLVTLSGCTEKVPSYYWNQDLHQDLALWRPDWVKFRYTATFPASSLTFVQLVNWKVDLPCKFYIHSLNMTWLLLFYNHCFILGFEKRNEVKKNKKKNSQYHIWCYCGCVLLLYYNKYEDTLSVKVKEKEIIITQWTQNIHCKFLSKYEK